MPPIVFVHVVLAYLGLISGLIVMIMPKKGNKMHKKLGMFYFISMMSATLLAIYICIIRPDRIFLLFIGIFTFHCLLGGFMLTHKRYPKYKWVFIPLNIVGLVNGICMIYTGSIVLIAFGLIQLLSACLDVKMFFNRNLHPLQIVKAHAGKMAGSFTAATTAFGVNILFSGADWWHWLLPTLVITPISIRWGMKLDKKRKEMITAKQKLSV